MILRNFICSLFLIGTAVSTERNPLGKHTENWEKFMGTPAAFETAAPVQTNPSFKGNWSETFETDTPWGDITHTPTSLSFGTILSCLSMQFQPGRSFKGLVFKFGLDVHVDMTAEEFVAALNTARIYKQ